MPMSCWSRSAAIPVRRSSPAPRSADCASLPRVGARPPCGAACAQAGPAAADDRIVTFGVRPTRPATEYGYIRAGASVGPNIFAIDKFVEKPDAKTAEHYVSEGYLWNSGNFVFRAGLLLDEYK